MLAGPLFLGCDYGSGWQTYVHQRRSTWGKSDGQHYVEEVGKPDHLRLVSDSDVFTPTGRIKIGVIWDLSVKKIDDQSCEFARTRTRSPLVTGPRWLGIPPGRRTGSSDR